MQRMRRHCLAREAITNTKYTEQTDGVNPCAFGTSGTSPAEQALVPEAGRDTSSGTFARKMRPLLLLSEAALLVALKRRNS